MRNSYGIQNSKLITENSKLKTENFPDFWSRRANAQTERFDFAPLGIPATITANRPEVLVAARLSAGRFCQSSARETPPIRLSLVVGSEPAGRLPPDLPEQLNYTGVADWITVSAGAWGHGFASLPSREAVIILSPELAADSRLVSRYFIDHYLLNFIVTEWAMLHASAVLSPNRERLIVLIAPHNTGKSTTALHLLRAGFHFLADGMLLFRPQADGVEVAGYPVGEVKLRDDVLAHFADYAGQPVRVREQRKTVVDLRQLHPGRVLDATFAPERISLCFVERRELAVTLVEPLTAAGVPPLLAGNSLYWDEPARLAHNTAALEQLIRGASLYRLRLGTELESIVNAVAAL
ncbi:MAG: hypothetical protein FOGNACKC_01003 [Anaerolineae bacterium]|nr:hypothetical protein [Anaerolineae bacterium]